MTPLLHHRVVALHFALLDSIRKASLRRCSMLIGALLDGVGRDDGDDDGEGWKVGQKG